MAVNAQRRTFNSEEHLCKICQKHFLGDKFFFLSGCEHYFCLPCMKEMVKFALNNRTVANLCCAEASCKKNLNDLDIRNMGLDSDLLEKYE